LIDFCSSEGIPSNSHSGALRMIPTCRWRRWGSLYSRLF